MNITRNYNNVWIDKEGPLQTVELDDPVTDHHVGGLSIQINTYQNKPIFGVFCPVHIPEFECTSPIR